MWFTLKQIYTGFQSGFILFGQEDLMGGGESQPI